MDPTIADTSRAIGEGTLSPALLTEAYLQRIDALDADLQSYVTVLRDAALDAAHAAARDIAAGRSRGTLHGIPIGLKDIYKTRGIRTTAGSRRYEHYVPEEDAESWVKLRNAGAILLGKHADYVEALRRRRELAVEFAHALEKVDVAVSANATRSAPRIDSVSTYSTFERASYTPPYNLTGSPALLIPIGFENGLPLAFQIAGKPFDEAGVMRVGHAFEQATEFHRQRPPIADSLPQQLSKARPT